MTSSQLSPRFVVFVVVSLITHLLELAASGLFCHMLIQQGDLKTPWFSVAAGLLIIPLVAVQLASAVFLLRRKGESSTTCEVTATAVLHVLQLGFISRHFAILQEAPLSSKRAEVVEMLILRISFAFTSGCTLFLMQSFLLFQNAHESSWTWAAYVAGITTLISVTWAVATYRRFLPETELDVLLITWPGTLLRILWRAGEILTRMIALGLFASLYTHWLFLVVGLHWLAMLLCVCVPVMTSLDWRTTGYARRTIFCIMHSFSYIFAFINTSAENAVFRYTFYYVVLFLENATLTAVWLIKSSSEEFSQNSIFVYIAAVSFVISIISMIVYYKFFHIVAVSSNPSRACGNTNCMTCKLGDSATHPPIPPRPGPAGNWLSQYQSAVICGQYYKHNLQDSLLDSVSERNSTVTVSSSHARLQQKLATIDDEVRDHDSSQCRQAKCDRVDACSSSVSNTDEKNSSKAGRKKGHKKRKGTATTSESEISSARTEADHSEDSGSQKRPVWLPSGDSNFANQLLSYSLETFDTADTADDERSSVATGCNHGYHHSSTSASPRGISAVSKRSHKETAYPGMPFPSGEHHWYSDGYSTDRTLEWPKMGLTSLQRNMWPGTQDSGSDCTHCRKCSHGDSEVSSIMRSVTTVPESIVEGDLPHCHHSNHHRKPHHLKGSHHGHGLPSRNEDSCGVPKRSRHDKLSPRNLDVSQEQKSAARLDGRIDILSSPASDPSHGPKTKRKHTARQHGLASGHHNTPTSHPQSNKNHSINKNLPPDQMCSDSKDINHSLVQSEKLAGELLKTAAHVDQLRSKDRPNNTSSSTSDPRFNVRVMTSPRNDESGTCTSDASSKGKSVSKKTKSHVKGYEKAPKSQEKDPERRHNENKHSLDDSAVTDLCSKLTDIAANSSKELSPATAFDMDKSETQADNHNSSDVAVDTAETQGEVIYENIWQAEQSLQNNVKPDRTVDGKTHVSDSELAGQKGTRRLTGSTRDAWYVCSESEDSALPPEALSSSVDGFTASENDSDVSMEIVI